MSRWRVALPASGLIALGISFILLNPSAASARQSSLQLQESIKTRPASFTITPRPHPVLPAAPPARTDTVRPGDSLSLISARYYGTTAGWVVIWKANKAKISDPNAISAGQVLIIPPKPAHWPAAPVAAAQPSPPQWPSGYTGGSYGTPSAAFTQCVITRESGGDPTAYNASSGASGLFGFLLSTWDSLGIGYPGGAYTAPVSVQYQGFYKLYAEAGPYPWQPFDGC